MRIHLINPSHGTVKLTKTRLTTPKMMGSSPTAYPGSWGSLSPMPLNLTVPWREIDAQLKDGTARVYVPDICIAETFKVIAKKYYEEGWFSTTQAMNNARVRFRREIVNKPEALRAANRVIRHHDLPTSRDIVISVDRFYRLFMKHRKRVSLPDLILVGAAKYLLDFFDLSKSHLHIVTLDRPLWEGSKKIAELPNAYDPPQAPDRAERVFL